MIDASGSHALKEFYDRCQKHKTVLLLSGVHGQNMCDLHDFGLDFMVGKNNIFPHIDAALDRAQSILADCQIS